MDNVMIKNTQGEQLSVNVVRYFRLNGMEYLVFSLNEVDDGGYVKLYIARVNGEVANTITDDVEWNLIKDTIKTIIKSNKDNLPLAITDLDIRKLENIQVINQKVFKLNETFIQLLSANKKIETYIEPVQNVLVSEAPAQDNFSVVEPIVQPVQPTINDYINSNNVQTSISEKSSAVMQAPTLEDNVSNFENTASYELDYKLLYENEVNKNKLLTEENERYKIMINNLKNIINEVETF